MRTTIDLPDPLLRKVRTRAVQQGVKLKDLVTKYLEAGLRDPSAEAAKNSGRKRSPLPIAIPRVSNRALTPARSNTELYAILDESDAARCRHS